MVGGSTGGSCVAVRQIPLVERHVLDADDAFVDFEFRDAIDEQERITVRQNPFDRRVVERSVRSIEERLYVMNLTTSPSDSPSDVEVFLAEMQAERSSAEHRDVADAAL